MTYFIAGPPFTKLKELGRNILHIFIQKYVYVYCQFMNSNNNIRNYDFFLIKKDFTF